LNHQIAFLHTAEVYINTFSSLISQVAPSLAARHIVDEALLADARRDGITPELRQRIRCAMVEADTTGAAVVVCTCSTIGGVAETTGDGVTFAAMRIDRSMADEVVRTHAQWH